MPASETPVTIDLRKVATIVGALVALIGGTVLLVGYSRSAAWWLVEDAHSQDLDVRLVAASVAEDAKPPHKDSALKVDVDRVLVQLQQATVVMTEVAQSVQQAQKLSGAVACQQAGGSPHHATGNCIFLVDGAVELVPLGDSDALLARFKLPAKVGKALRESPP